MTVALVLLNICVFFVEAGNPESIIGTFALWPIGTAAGHPFHVWQIVTYSALHAGLAHLALNMFGLFMFGGQVERVLGRLRLLVLYLASVVAGGVTQIVVLLATMHTGTPTVGASAGVFGLLVSYAVMFPQRRVVLLFPPIPMPAWLFATGYALIELLAGVSGDTSGVAHFAHLGGMLGAIVCLRFWGRAARRGP